MSSSNSKPVKHSPPLVFAPQQAHQTTLIILHGRGSTAEKFAAPLLNHNVTAISSESIDTTTQTASSESFQSKFPTTKFVFPTAPLRRAVAFNRCLTHQWFDNWSLTEPQNKQHLQIQGLRETSVFLHTLLREEIKLVGAKNAVLMGLSQGCAASLIATLLWDGEPFGGVVGMCGYLPFCKDMQGLMEEDGDLEGGDDFFEHQPDGSEDKSKLEKVAQWLREELQTGDEDVQREQPPPIQSMPMFLAHGTEDEKVPCEFGRLAADFLKCLDVDLVWKEYEGLGHWYSEDMLRDVVHFLKGLEGPWSPP